MVVYVDLLFLINLLIDGALLLLTAWTRKKTVRWWRLLLSAGIGASYVVFMLVPELSVLYTFIIKVLFSVLMIVTAFGFDQIRSFLRTLGAFYVVSFAAAGGIIGIHYVLMSSSEVMNGIWYTRTGGLSFSFQVSLTFVLVLFVFSGLLYLRVFQSAKQRQQAASFIADVRVQVGTFSYSCKGLIDTGNQLYDPLTKTPVMVVEADNWKPFLPETWIKRIRDCDVDQMVSSMGEDDFPLLDRLRLVPYRGINRGTQFMLAIKPDLVTVHWNETKRESSRVLVGFDGGKLSSDGTYQAILHPALMEA